MLDLILNIIFWCILYIKFKLFSCETFLLLSAYVKEFCIQNLDIINEKMILPSFINIKPLWGINKWV